MTIEGFLARFETVKKAGNQFMVRCPAHADQGPSLAIKDGREGILLHCHAGCSTENVLSALNLTAPDLFPDKISSTSTSRTIIATYDYQDEDSRMLFQVLRYSPKGFAQRRPNGQDWIYNLQGVRRVLYRLPELLGQKAILWVEGEKDADAAWKIGIPATCKSGGAGGWEQSYVEQLKRQGVERLAIIPDNDAAGREHAATVARACHEAGLGIRLVELPWVPPGGDLSDYLQAGHGKDDVLGLVRAAPVGVLLDVRAEPSVKVFDVLGEQRYRFTTASGIVLEVNRLHRSSHELVGELSVHVNGQFLDAKTYGDGVLQVGDLNFSSVQARSTRAKLLMERAGDKSVDWYGYLEEFVTRVIEAERRGKPAEVLADVPEDDPDTVGQVENWTVDGFPLLPQLPQVIFGGAASGKSYFAMWLAGQLAARDIPVLYADWEFSRQEHRKRLGQLFPVLPTHLLYVRCEHSIRHELDHLLEIVQQHGIRFIVCDSIGFAVEGPAEAQEGATGYFRALRQLRIGSLNIAHPPKLYDDQREATIFGSVFFLCGARSVWYMDRAKENPAGEVRFGLYHRKSNLGALLEPKGYRLLFRSERTLVEPINLKDVDELAAGFPLLDRMKELLKGGPMTAKAIAEELSVTVPQVQGTIGRYRSKFVKVGQKIGIVGQTSDSGSGEQAHDDETEF